MRALIIVKANPFTNQFLGLKAVADLMQIDALILKRSPESLDEDVVHTSTLAIHADFDARIKQHLRKLVAIHGVQTLGLQELGNRVSPLLNVAPARNANSLAG